MLCPKCQSELSEGTKFCPNCGTALAAQEAPRIIEVESEPIIVEKTSEPIVVEYVTEKKPSKIGTYVGAAAAVLSVGGVLVDILIRILNFIPLVSYITAFFGFIPSALAVLGVLCGIVGLVMSIIAKKNGGSAWGIILSLVGLIVGAAYLVISLVIGVIVGLGAGLLAGFVVLIGILGA